MKGSRWFRPLLRYGLTLIALAVAQSAPAQTTQFTYQGKLADGGAPANGNYDFQFKLFDTPGLSTGTQQGSTVALTGVAVAGGIFTVQLDFGICPSCFNGATRYLEISVKSAGGPTFTTLGPRQQVTSTPYAIKSLNATTADGLSVACVNCVTSTQIASVSGSAVSGAIPVASVPAGSANYIQNTTSPQAAANFNIAGSGTAGGTLSASVVNAATQYNLGGARILSTGDTGNLFAGLNAGAANTTGFDNSFFGKSAGQANTTGNNNSFFGLNAGVNNQTGGANSFFGQNAGAANTIGDLNAFFGAGAGFSNTTGGSNTFFGKNAGAFNTTGGGNTFIGLSADFNTSNPTGDNNTLLGNLARVNSGVSNATAIGASAQVTRSNSLVLGGASVSVGIGTPAPVARLQVVPDDDNNPGVIAAWDGRHFVVGRTSSIGGIGMSYSQATGVGYIESLIPNVAWGNLVLQSGGGRVGIGTTNPDQSLTVNGNASKPGGGSWAVFSDARLKAVTGRFTTGLKAVMQLQPLRYEYRRGNPLGIRSDGQHIGFTAQAVRRVIPEAVSEDEKGYLLVNNDPLIWAMLNAIKEQQKAIEHLKAALRRLRAKVRRGGR